MYSFTRIIPFTIKDLVGVWDDIDVSYVGMLTISLKGEKTVTPSQQLECYYYGRQLIHYDLDIAKTSFYMTFNDNIHLVLKIGRYLQDLNKLQNMEIWGDVVTHASQFASGMTNNQISKGTNKLKGSNSDANSLVNTEYLSDLMNIDENVPVPGNILTQSTASDDSIVDITNKLDNSNKSITSTSNISRDYIDSIRLKLPALRKEFWGKFRYLFR